MATTCDDLSLSETFYRDTGLPLAIFPSNAATWASGGLEFVGQGGAPEYAFSVEDADGGTIDPETGVYTAPPVAGEYTVAVTDRAGETRPAVVYVVEERPLRISPRSASVAIGQTKEFVASGGEGGYVYSTDPSGVGTVGSATGLFTAVAAGSTNVKVFDGSNTVAAAVLVYEGVPGELQVTIDEPEIEQGASTGLAVIYGTPSTAVSLAPAPPPDLDPPGDLGFISGLGDPDWTGQYIAGDSIGRIEITATDTGPPEETSSIIITVLPATPTDLVADNNTGSPGSIRLNWDHSAPLPDTNAGFEIYRSSSSSASMQPVGTVGPTDRTYLDTNVSPSISYYIYEVVAFTENFSSRPSERSLPTTSKP